MAVPNVKVFKGYWKRPELSLTSQSLNLTAAHPEVWRTDILNLPFAGGGIGNDRTVTVKTEDTARKGLFVYP